MRAMRPALVVDPIFLRLLERTSGHPAAQPQITTCLALRETPPSQLVAPTIERLFLDVVALAPILHRLVPVLGLPQVADDLLVGKSLLHRVLLATRIKENSLAKCYKKRLRSYALYARRAGSVCPMPDGLSVRVTSGTGAAPERVRTGMSGALRRNTRVPGGIFGSGLCWRCDRRHSTLACRRHAARRIRAGLVRHSVPWRWICAAGIESSIRTVARANAMSTRRSMGHSPPAIRHRSAVSPG